VSDKPIALTEPPEGYGEWLAGLKARIYATQQRATLAVNRELLLLYWQIGRDILARQAEQGWGSRIVARLSHDLIAAFPDMKGFSRANLMYMRAFAFVGRQVHSEVGGEDFYLDLLFYHLRLRCYVVIELKAGEFRPEHLGQLGFYLTAVDVQVKHESDGPTIGLLLN